ncbi:MAG: YARHG domain-containing protein [Bacteroidota bacterium]
MKRSILFVIPAVLFLCTLGPRADDGVFLGKGADIYPAEEAKIRLDYELLTVTHTEGEKGGNVRVEALFILSNTGEARTVTVGFPEESGYSPEETDEQFPTIMNFTATVDGVPVGTVRQTLREPNEDFAFDWAYLWRVRFGKGETRVIRNTYDYKPAFDSIGLHTVRYILRTGALWAGPIGRIDIVVRSPIPVPWMAFVPYPEEYSHFHAANWEPDRDIDLSYRFWSKEEIPAGGRSYIYPSADTKKAAYGEAAAARCTEIRQYIAGLTGDKLAACTKWEIQAYINGIYATHGRSFKDPAWSSFFAGKWWYQINPSYGEGALTVEDHKTIARLKAFLGEALEAE